MADFQLTDEFLIGGIMFAITAIIIAVLYWSNETSRLSKGYKRILATDKFQDAIVLWLVVYGLFVMVLGLVNIEILKAIVNRSGLNPTAIDALVGTTNGSGEFASYLFIIVLGTLFFSFGISLIIIGFLNQFLDLKLDVTTGFTIALWTVGLILILLEVGFIIWVALLGLMYVLIASV